MVKVPVKGKARRVDREVSMMNTLAGTYHESRNHGSQHFPEPPQYIDPELSEPRRGAREYPVRHNAVRVVRETDRIRREREDEEPT